MSSYTSPAVAFLLIFALRYVRFIGHFIGYHWLYRPAEVFESQPLFTGEDVTVILPTVEPHGPDFEPCVVSILRAKPANLFVVTVGESLLLECKRVLAELKSLSPLTTVWVSALPVASKRKQVAHAVPRVTTAITILADDHVFWPSDSFIASIIAPFEDEDVGAVAPVKRVIRNTEGEWSFKSILNFLACGYLQRHNWELRASNAIDGGVFVISGRTAAYRTYVLQTPGLLHRLCNETFFFGLFGGKEGLGPDDDNFLTREVMHQGLKIKFQDTKDATIVTSLGEWPKFRGQLVRWARTTFRSNPVMLRSPSFLARYPWSYLMVYVAGITNFALLWDVALIMALPSHGILPVLALLSWFFFTKTVKLYPHLARHPDDILLLPAQIAFGYVHSVVKLWALLTFWDCGWSGRNLGEISTEGQEFAWEEVYSDEAR